MDIKKEREAFEALFNHLDLNYVDNLEYCEYETQMAWEAWQAAKAQADQKVKLLLCDEHLKKCESPTGVFNSQYPDEEPCLICLAKEAKAQAGPEESKHEGGYYLQDCRGYIGNCMKFWYTHGYGAKLHNFHWFPTLDDALEAAGGAPWHKPWYAPYVDSLAEKTIDMQLADREQEKAMIKAQEPAND